MSSNSYLFITLKTTILFSGQTDDPYSASAERMFHSPCCGFRSKHIHITEHFHEADYVREAKDGCIAPHAQLCLLGSKSNVSKVPCQTSYINQCFMLALLRVSLSIPS
jgi:hypothetical protein